ncbi:MAG: CDP-alcohol phosphatidyltransferase family protein [Anaerolineales bacterium]
MFWRRILAWSVHLFTASGAIWGFLSILAIQQHNWKAAIVWMAIAMFVDGFDGTLARRFDTKRLAASLDGALLDNILDYLNYVLVPVLFLWEADFLPPASELWVAIAILLASAYQFTQVDAKTEDHYFKGFPCYWNVMVIYMLVLQLPPWVNLAFTIFFVVLIFVPVKYLYPSRTAFLRPVTLALTYAWAALGVYGLILYPNVPEWLVNASFVYVGYYVVASLLPYLLSRRREEAAA